MKQLHPGIKWSFRIGTYFAMLFLAMFFGWFILPVFVFISTLIMGSNAIAGILVGVIVFILIYLMAVIVIAEVYTKLAYKNWMYEFGEDNLKIEKGIIWKKYSNIPYERVQNVDITRGILARMLGFSTVNIQTAGYSYSPNGVPRSEGHLPAVDMAEAEQIREFVMGKISKKGRSQGL